jgi:hypothetical protein
MVKAGQLLNPLQEVGDYRPQSVVQSKIVQASSIIDGNTSTRKRSLSLLENMPKHAKRIDEIVFRLNFHSERDQEKNYKLHFLSFNNVIFK